MKEHRRLNVVMVNARSEVGGRNKRASRLGVRLRSAAFSDDGATTSDQRDLIAKDFKKQGLTRRRGDAEMRERVMGKEVSEAKTPSLFPLFPSVQRTAPNPSTPSLDQKN